MKTQRVTAHTTMKEKYQQLRDMRAQVLYDHDCSTAEGHYCNEIAIRLFGIIAAIENRFPEVVKP